MLPGVVNASVVFQLPLAGSGATTSVAIEGRPVDPADRPTVVIHMAGPDYFRTMGIPVVRGRDFTERDDLNAPPVLIVNEALARQYFPNEDPIGKRIAPGFSTLHVRDDDTGMREVVGVVADVKHQNLQGPPQPEIYFAQSQMPMSAMTVVVRAAGDPARCSGRCAASSSRSTGTRRSTASGRSRRSSIARWPRRASTRCCSGCSPRWR